MFLNQENYDKLFIKKIEMSSDLQWLKNLLRKKTKFSDKVIEKIKQIHSLEISNLLIHNYSEQLKQNKNIVNYPP